MNADNKFFDFTGDIATFGVMKKILISLIITCLGFPSFGQLNNMEGAGVAGDSSVHTQGDAIDVIASPIIEEMRTRYANQQKTRAVMPGYRIQYFAGSRSQAFESKAILLNKNIGLPVTIEYEQPYFKTKIGNFRTELEAERVLRELGEHCKGCFVIRDQITYEVNRD